MRLEHVSDLQQGLLAHGRGHLAPDDEGVGGCSIGRVDLGGGALGRQGEDLAGGRIDQGTRVASGIH